MRISVEESTEFKKDLAFYSISDERHDRIRDYLGDNPVAGTPHPDDPKLREWEVGKEVVTFIFAPEIGAVILLRIQP